MNQISTVLILAVMLTGCTESIMRGEYRSLQRQGQPPAYIDGYMAGCPSGYVAAGHPYFTPQKDVFRFKDDELYAMGWEDGYDACKSSYQHTSSLLR